MNNIHQVAKILDLTVADAHAHITCFKESLGDNLIIKNRNRYLTDEGIRIAKRKMQKEPDEMLMFLYEQQQKENELLRKEITGLRKNAVKCMRIIMRDNSRVTA